MPLWPRDVQLAGREAGLRRARLAEQCGERLPCGRCRAFALGGIGRRIDRARAGDVAEACRLPLAVVMLLLLMMTSLLDGVQRRRLRRPGALQAEWAFGRWRRGRVAGGRLRAVAGDG